MAQEPSSPLSATLQPPRKSVELEDPGAHELVESENEDDHFSDASEGPKPTSPIPITRVEKVDDIPSHGQVPGTAAYEMRTKDAAADEMEVIPDGARSRSRSRPELGNQSSTPGGAPLPITVVETVEPVASDLTQLPGAGPHEKHMADAVPDVVLPASEHSEGFSNASEPQPGSGTVNQPIPTTVVSKVDAEPSYGEVPGTDAYDMRKEDAEPDVVEEKGDVPESPTSPLHRSDHRTFTRRKKSVAGSPAIADDGGFGPIPYETANTYQAHQDDDDDGGFGDDFDDFEQGEGDEEFGGFDEGLQQTLEEDSQTNKELGVHQSLPSTSPSFPILDYNELGDIDDLLSATEPYLDDIFPHTHQGTSPTPSVDNISERNSIFLTERSLSLWSQLVAPPSLQPPNWVRSRIRRLFLVSLGVPVDLDEILPASKQKKLVLPSIHLHGDAHSTRVSSDSRQNGSITKLKQPNGSSASVDSTKGGRRRKGRPPAPELDLGPTRMLCTVTDEALTSFTDEELGVHIQRLQELTSRASEVLEYWLRRKDEALGDKEAFEGVIENLVKHARKVRK